MTSAFPAPPLRWVIAAEPDQARVGTLVAELTLPRPLAALLVQRGHATPDAAREFLRPKLSNLADPYSLAGMADAVDVIVRAVRCLLQ